METGASGVSGVLVLRRVNRDTNQEHVNVIHRLLSTVEKIVMGSQRKLKYATKKSLVQVPVDVVCIFPYNHKKSSVYLQQLCCFRSVDGNWGEWSEWSTCTKSCKQGKQSRTRECNSPAPQYGGKDCDGKPKETQICNEKVPCPGKAGIYIRFFKYFVVSSGDSFHASNHIHNDT